MSFLLIDLPGTAGSLFALFTNKLIIIFDQTLTGFLQILHPSPGVGMYQGMTDHMPLSYSA